MLLLTDSPHFNYGDFGNYAQLWQFPSFFFRRQRERNVLSRVRAAAYGHHDVLLAIHHVCHRRAALRGGQVDRAHLFSCGFIIRAQHRASWMLRCGCDLAIAGDHKRLGNKRADVIRGLACAGDIQPLERGMVADHIRCFAVRDLPDDFAFVQIDG